MTNEEAVVILETKLSERATDGSYEKPQVQDVREGSCNCGGGCGNYSILD